MRNLLAIVSLLVLLLCVPWSGAAILIAIVTVSCRALYALAVVVVAVPGLVVAARAGLGGLSAASQGHVKTGYRWRELALALVLFGVWVLVAALPSPRC